MKGHHIQFLLLVRKFRIVLAVLMLVTFLSGLYLLAPAVLRYSSHTSFYLLADKLYNPASSIVEDNISITEYSMESKRIENLLYSTEMISYLVKNYNLYSRYGIDSTSQFAREMMANQIRDNVSLNKTTSDFFMVYVDDRNNEIAAAMANSIVKQLDVLNREYIKNKISVHIRLYNTFIAESNKMNDDYSVRIKDLLSELNQARLVGNAIKQNGEKISDIEYSIFEAVNKISQITVQNLNTQKFLFNSMKMMDQTNTATIIMVARALPDTTSRRLFLVLYSLGAAIAVLVVTITVLYLLHYYNEELKLVFGRNQAG
jgi:hypothetical protein